ncbi:Ankyrin repeat-containing protein [Phytophthora palmivora]|uniref:Ankyrin repeat-containing protein n=1 Tax=Phytophthora palmivora TaxID=4796 RepID=A0A2P4X906_9STRA|nr:Ankyrin repeat-containing protein [Phytophthora palmivora]
MPASASAVSETHYELIRDAIFDNDRDRVAELLAVPGVDVDHFDAGGQTLLHLACFWGRMELAKLLLAAGASLKTKNAAGCTALDLATHWGHSAVAEVIRLRGGSSVWEDKFGALQVELEDLTLRAQHLETQNNDKLRQLEFLAKELQAAQTQLAEEKSAHTLTIDSYQRAQQLLNVQVEKNQQLEQEKASLTEQLKMTTTSVKKQEEAAHNWQRAEVAAAMADSQRNFAFAERDQLHRAQLATLAELLVTTERLGAAEDELMKLKTDLAEHIFEMRREQRNQKRIAHALTSARGNNVSQVSRRPTTTPAEMTTNIKKTRKPEEVQQLLQVARETPKKIFSLAAREYGDRVYLDEKQKLRERGQRHQRVENQYRAHGFRAPVVDAEVFQEEFVSTVRAFASCRSEKWKNLKRERDRQAHFATTTLARPISTAPLSLNSPSGLEGTLNYSLYRKYALPLPHNSGTTNMRPATSCTELRMHADFLSETKKKKTNYPQLHEEPTNGERNKLVPFLPMV